MSRSEAVLSPRMFCVCAIVPVGGRVGARRASETMGMIFSTALHACDPARNLWRAYRVEAGRDLLGDWLVEVTFGRIGSGGRMVRYVAADEAGARRLARSCLQRRVSSPRRIGIPYEELGRFDPTGWANW